MPKKQKINKSKIRKQKRKEQRSAVSVSTRGLHSEPISEKAIENLPDKKVKILSAKYNQNLDIIVLEVKPIENNIEEKTFRMSIRFSDIKQNYNITANVPPYLILKFCKELEGKEKTLKSLGANLPDKEETSKMNGEEIQQTATFWHEYPFWETYLLENNGVVIDQETKKR